MADPRDLRGRWSWQVAGFEARPPSTDDDEEVLEIAGVTNTNNMNISSRYSTPTMPPKQSLMYAKVQQLNEEVLAAREEFLELRQEASDLQEYSNAKLGRVMRYLGVLAEKARKLDRIALETESRIAPLIMERKKLFNDLLSIRGNIRVFCRVRPQFEDEGSPATEFPDIFTIRINPGGDPVTSSKRDYEFDRVYGPHVGQGDFFQDVQPFIQSALDGYNVTIFAYGQTGSGKTHTMEGSSHDRGVYFRAFEEIFDLSNADATASSKFYFYVTIFTLHNEQIYDLLATSSGNLSRINMGMPGFSVEVVQEKVENPTDFSRVMKLGLQNQGRDNLNVEQHKRSHLIVTIHIHCSSSITGQSHYSKLSLVDLAGSERLPKEETKGENLTELLHVNKSLSALGDVVCALTAQKDYVPYGNSRLTQILADSLGGDSKTLIIVNVSPTSADVRETISSLNFAARARNVELSLGNRDTIKKWRDMANEARKEVFEKEKEVTEANQEIMTLKKQLQEADNQSLLLFSEVQKAWKVAFALQADLKAESVMLQEQHKIEKAQNEQLRNQIAQLMKVEQEEKIHLVESKTMIQTLEAKVKEFEWKLSEVQAGRRMDKGDTDLGQGPVSISNSQVNNGEKDMTNLSVTRKLEEELAKRDKLIERLHEENEKLFERLTNRSVPEGSPKVASKNSGEVGDLHLDVSVRKGSSHSISLDQGSLSSGGTLALVKSNSHKIKTTPAGEYLTAALMDFNPDQYENLATVADGANKLLMLVLAAVIKAGAAREHEMLAEIQDSVFSFIRKMEPRRVMDTMLVSRVRILYIRSLLSRSPELQAIKIPPVEHFLEKASTGHSRNSSRGSSPGRSPGHYYQNSSSDLLDEHIRAFKVNIRQDKKSKFSSIVLKLRGIDQETWRQHVTGGKLREITEEARTFATGNKTLAALFVHTPAGELQRQIRAWLAQNFNFLSVTGGDSVAGVAGQLELLSTAIMDGWMAGLGTPQHPSTDALGQLLSNYTKRIYTSQLQHLKDIAGTLATEEADDLPSITKLRSALESVEHKRRKILLQVRTDIALLTKEQGGSPVQNPSTAAEDARLASLISLEDILRQMEDIKKEAFEKPITAITKKALLEALNELLGRMPSLLSIDHPCAQRHIKDAYKIIENIEPINDNLPASIQSAENEVVQWSVLQFNTGSTAPFVIKCGATSNSELVVKAQAKFQETSHEIVAIVPKPSVLANMSMEEMKQILSQLPESLCELALARTADGTRARYSRLYRTLAMRVPSMKNSINELEKDESSRDVVNPSTPSNRSTQFQRSAESHNMSEVTQ